MHGKRRFLWLSLALVFALTLAACGSQAPAPADQAAAPAAPAPQPTQQPTTPAAPKRLVIAQGTDAVTLDAHMITDSPTAAVAEHIYESLFNLEDGRIVPHLAESATLSDDGLTWTITLKQGIKFHDGTTLDAEVVRYNIMDRFLNPDIAIPFRFLLSAIQDVRVVNDHTIAVITAEPFAPLLSHFTHSSTSIISKKALEELGEAVTDSPVGTGPFKLKGWTKGEEIVLEKNPDYWGTPAKLDEVVFKTVPEDGSRVVLAESGEADVVVRVPPEEVQRLQALPNLDVVETPSVRTIYIYFNTINPPFDNPLVRHALNYAVNKQAIATAIQRGTVRPSDAPLAPGIFGYSPQTPYTYDPAKARELLAEAGFPDGFKTILYHPQGRYPQDARVAEAVRAQLREVGVEVELRTMEWGNYLDFVRKPAAENEVTMAMLGWGTVTGDADYGLYALMHSSQHPPAFNLGFYTNAEVDRLLETGRTVADEAARAQAYRIAGAHIWHDAPWLFLYSETQLTAVNTRVEGLEIHVTERVMAHNADVR